MTGDTKKRVAAGLLTLSLFGLGALTQLEGYEERVYIPVPGDAPTAGYGHKEARLPVGKLITKEQAMQWLQEDVKFASDAIKQCIKVPISQQEFDAYVLFAYNVGQTAFCNSTLVKKLNSADYNGACNELHRWVYSGGVKYKGLENRRAIENLICQEGIYPQ